MKHSDSGGGSGAGVQEKDLVLLLQSSSSSFVKELYPSGDTLGADVVIKCVGFELNEGNERLLCRTRITGALVDDGLWCVFEAHPDANFSGGSFGSYLDSVQFMCGQVLVRYWRESDLCHQQVEEVA